MKTWTNPSVEELKIENTAWGWDDRWYEWSIIYPPGGDGADFGDELPPETPEVPENPENPEIPDDGYTPLS